MKYTELADGKIRLELPAINPKQSIAAPTGTILLKLQAQAVSFSLNNNRCFSSAPGIVIIPYNDDLLPAQTIVLETQTEPACVVLLVVGLTYWKEKGMSLIPVAMARYMPAEIVAVYDKMRK